ncbi:lipid A biosynthesis lauroyl acyltransferase [compost metagenome]
MSQWKGQSKGSVLGYRIFVFCIQKLGIRTAYLLLVFVAFYYFLTSWSSNRSIYYYLRYRLKYSLPSTLIGFYRSYFTFGQILIDKTAIAAGMRNRFSYEFDGIAILKSALEKKNGGILLSAHIGNFEIASYFLEDINIENQINLVISDREHQAIKSYLAKVSRKSTVKFIVIQEDLSHVFAINEALTKNELIVFTGDRYLEGTKTLSADLLGKNTQFPAGPFLIASRLKVPVIFVYVMKEPKLHYHLYARELEVKHRDAQGLLQTYCQSLTNMIEKYPMQWFNFYDFWKDYSQ